MLLVQAALRAGIYPTCTGNTAAHMPGNARQRRGPECPGDSCSGELAFSRATCHTYRRKGMLKTARSRRCSAFSSSAIAFKSSICHSSFSASSLLTLGLCIQAMLRSCHAVLSAECGQGAESCSCAPQETARASLFLGSHGHDKVGKYPRLTVKKPRGRDNCSLAH